MTEELIFWEKNIIMRLLEAGFTSLFEHQKNFVPIGNWMGLELQHPDLILKKGDKFATFSAQGMSTPGWISWENPELSKAMSIRYIGLAKGKMNLREYIVYETATGELPPIELFLKFIEE